MTKLIPHGGDIMGTFLNYVRKRLGIDGYNWREVKGVKFYIDHIGSNTITIFVVCPRCGKIGILYKNRNRFRVVHDDGSCYFGNTTEHYKALFHIYKMVREVEGEYRLINILEEISARRWSNG